MMEERTSSDEIRPFGRVLNVDCKVCYSSVSTLQKAPKNLATKLILFLVCKLPSSG